MVAEPPEVYMAREFSCSLAKISMVAEHGYSPSAVHTRCSLAKISMVAEHLRFR